MPEPEPNASRAERLQQIAEDIRQCQACPLHRTRQHAVPGAGDPAAEVMLIGEGPGREEDRQGQPFVGASGKYLDQLLRSSGLSRSDIYITNVVKCRPPENRNPDKDEIAACRHWLETQIETIAPKLIVPMGNPALQWFVPGGRITKARSRPQLRPEGYAMLPAIHPAAGLHRAANRPNIEQDFGAIAGWLAVVKADPDGNGQPPPPETDGSESDDPAMPAPENPEPLDALLLRLMAEIRAVRPGAPEGEPIDPRQPRHRLSLLSQFARTLGGLVRQQPDHPAAPWRQQILNRVIAEGQRLNERIPQVCRDCHRPFYGGAETYRPERFCHQCE